MTYTSVLLNLVAPMIVVIVLVFVLFNVNPYSLMGASFFMGSVQLSVALTGFSLTVIALITNLISGGLGSVNKRVQEALQRNEKLKVELYNTFYFLTLASAISLILSITALLAGGSPPYADVLGRFVVASLGVAIWNLLLGILATFGIIKYYLFSEF